MIEINLLPNALRKKKPAQTIVLPSKFVIYVSFGTLGALILVHLVFITLILFKNSELKNLSDQWPRFQADKQKIDSIRKNLSNFDSNVNAIEKLTSKRSECSNILTATANLIPKGIWLNYLSLSKNRFILQGSAVSKKSEEMALISKFSTDLKANPVFSKGIKNLELGPVKRRYIRGWEVVDFIFTGTPVE